MPKTKFLISARIFAEQSQALRPFSDGNLLPMEALPFIWMWSLGMWL
jgi:hypothetical protein